MITYGHRGQLHPHPQTYLNTLCPTKANQGFLFVSAKPNRPALAVAIKVYSPSINGSANNLRENITLLYNELLVKVDPSSLTSVPSAWQSFLLLLSKTHRKLICSSTGFYSKS